LARQQSLLYRLVATTQKLSNPTIHKVKTIHLCSPSNVIFALARSPSGKGEATRRYGRGGSHEARSGRTERRRVSRGGLSVRTFAAIGGEARGSAHGGYGEA